MSRRAVAVVASVAAMGLSVVAVSAPAYAGQPRAPFEMTTDGSDGGRVEFTPSGDKVRVCDEASDGLRAVVRVYNHSKGVKEYGLHAADGEGDCETVTQSDGQPWNLAEGDCFKFVVSLRNGEHGNDNYADEAFWRNYNDQTAGCDPS